MASKWSLLNIIPSVLAVEGPGAFFTGFAEGLLGKTQDVKKCAQDFGQVASAGMHVVEDFQHKDVNKTAADIQQMLASFAGSIKHCKGAVGELRPFLDVMDGVHGPGDLYQKLKQNGLDNDEAILEAFEGAGKYCTFKEPNGELCGQSLGRPIRFILLGADAVDFRLGVSGPGAFFSGFAEGLLGDGESVRECSKDLGAVAQAGGRLLEDWSSKNINRSAADIQSLLIAFQGSIANCRDIAGDLKPFLHVLDGVRSPGDLAQKIRQNILDGDESILDAFEGAGKYCTFREPNGHKCGKSLGRPLRIVLLGGDSLQLTSEGPAGFVGGFMKGLIGDSTDVRHCGSDLASVAASGAHLVADLGKFNATRTATDIEGLLHSLMASLSDCKAAVGDLKPLLQILHGVRSPADLYAKLKQNGLENDEDILDSFEDASRFCTFAEPNGHKCGESIGRPIRLILVGSEFQV